MLIICHVNYFWQIKFSHKWNDMDFTALLNCIHQTAFLALLFLMGCLVFPLFCPTVTVTCFPLMWTVLISVGIHWNGTQSLTAVSTLTLLREPFRLMNTWTERQLFGTISLWWQPKSVSIPQQQQRVHSQDNVLQYYNYYSIFSILFLAESTFWISEFVQTPSNHQED